MCSSRDQSAELGAGSFEDTSHRTQHHNTTTAVLSTATPVLLSIYLSIEKSYFVEGVPVGDEAPLGRVGAAGRLRRHLAGVHEAVAVVVLRHRDQGRGGEVRAGGLVTGLLQYLTLASQLQHREQVRTLTLGGSWAVSVLASDLLEEDSEETWGAAEATVLSLASRVSAASVSGSSSVWQLELMRILSSSLLLLSSSAAASWSSDLLPRTSESRWKSQNISSESIFPTIFYLHGSFR